MWQNANVLSINTPVQTNNLPSFLCKKEKHIDIQAICISLKWGPEVVGEMECRQIFCLLPLTWKSIK